MTGVQTCALPICIMPSVLKCVGFFFLLSPELKAEVEKLRAAQMSTQGSKPIHGRRHLFIHGIIHTFDKRMWGTAVSEVGRTGASGGAARHTGRLPTSELPAQP